jgi:hypothetical protein
VGDGQKAEFKKTANLIYSATVAGAAVVGMAKGALRGPKPKAPGAPKAAKPVAAREVEIAGTGMRVKVPVQEMPSSTAREFAARKGDGKGSTNKVGPAKKTKRKERKIDTPEGQNAHWDNLKNSGEWKNETGYSKSTLKNKKDGRLIQKSREKWEIEVYNEQKEHIGVIKPGDGKFYPELKVKGRKIKK